MTAAMTWRDLKSLTLHVIHSVQKTLSSYMILLGSARRASISLHDAEEVARIYCEELVIIASATEVF